MPRLCVREVSPGLAAWDAQVPGSRSRDLPELHCEHTPLDNPPRDLKLNQGWLS